MTPPKIVLREVLGLLFLVLACAPVAPLVGNDDEPARGVVTKTDKEAKAALVEIEIGGDTPTVKKEAGAEPDGQAAPAETPPGSLPGMSSSGNKSKVLRGGKSGVGRGKIPKANGDSGSGSMPSGSMLGPPGQGSRMGSMVSGQSMGGTGMPLNKLYAESAHVILKQSKTGDALWGYSETLGKWTKLTIPKQSELLTPTVGDSVGEFKGEGRVYAYSSATGRWGELRTSAQPVVYQNKIKVQDQDKVFIFSDVTGRWSSPDEGADAATGAIDDSNAPDAAQPSSPVDDAGRGVVFGDFDSDWRLDVVVPENSEKMKAADLLKSLQVLYRESERQTIQAAAEYRQARQRLGEKNPKTLELRAGLARLVQESFDRRQQAHRLEAEMLRRRLQRVDERLSDRERLKTQITQRRLEELQNSNVRWETEPDDQAGHRERSARNRFESPARIDMISPFVGRGRSAVDVGVVSNVTDDGWIELSPKEVSGIRVGDEFEVNRADFVHDDGTQQYRRFAHVFVVKAEPEVASARIVESTRVLLDNKYVWDSIVKGNGVARPDATDDQNALAKNKALVDLQGQWLCVSQNDGGRETPSDELQESQRTLFITGDRVRLVYLGDGDLFTARRFTVDADQVPHHLDFAVTDELQKNFRNTGIYQIDGHTLRICLGKTRPTEFKGGPDVYFCTYELQTLPQQASAPATPSESTASAGVNPLSQPVSDGVTVRELRADSIPLEFAVFDPPEKDPPVDTKVVR